jgi:ubiquinone/menaquinone biosynthesis C-methylase UbiE
MRLRFVIPVVVVAAVALVQAQQRDPKQYQQVLENPDRVAALQVDKVVASLGLTAGMRVADLGAGTGVFTVPLARAVGPGGKVFAIDIDPALLAIVREKAVAGQLSNIQTVVAGETDPQVPGPVDLIFLADTLHHLPNQGTYVKQFSRLLRPGGRVSIIEFAPGKWPAGHESFMILPAQVDAWMAVAGFSRSDVHPFLDTNFFHVYRLSK